MVGKSDQQCALMDNYNPQRHDGHTFSSSVDDSMYHENRWHTSAQDAFSIPEFEKIQVIGRRRDLVRTIVNKRVLQKIEDDLNPKQVVDDGLNPSEYSDKFCDSKFTPFMDRLDTDTNKLIKYPLYVGNNQTFYKEQIERGTIKLRTEILDLNEPFRKNCAFTTSPENAIREPTGGY